MKFTASTVLAATLVLLVSSSTCRRASAYTPIRISLEDLQNGHAENVLRQALEDVGMISITNVFESREKERTLELLPAIIMDNNAIEHTYEDGTLRRTIATHTVGTTEPLEPLPISPYQEQNEAQSTIMAFRQKVGNVLEVFGTELSAALELDAFKTLLQNEKDSTNYNLAQILDHGEHLEHFHCYYSSFDSGNKQEETIEWHTDQGLLLAFTPGMVNGETTDGFYIQLADGSTEMVDFDKTDDLVFLLGDGVNQYVNGALDTNKPLRALPHALSMPSTKDPRVWYGRMVLPPSNAKHPLHPQLTFGEIRQGMMAEDAASSSIGCSQNLVARELEATTCEEGVASYCWHRCMNHSDYGVSEAICAEQNRRLACVNDDGDLWPHIHDPQFKLGCAEADAKNWTAGDDVDGNSHGDGHGHDNGDGGHGDGHGDGGHGDGHADGSHGDGGHGDGGHGDDGHGDDKGHGDGDGDKDSTMVSSASPDKDSSPVASPDEDSAPVASPDEDSTPVASPDEDSSTSAFFFRRSVVLGATIATLFSI